MSVGFGDLGGLRVSMPACAAGMIVDGCLMRLRHGLACMEPWGVMR